MKTECTDTCIAARAKERTDLAAYTEKWPNFCRKCGAAGLESWQENQSPLGSGECWNETLTDYCPDCVGQGRCPRCNRMYDNNFSFDLPDGKLLCFACNWTEGDVSAPEVLNDSECGCFEDALETEQEKERALFRPLDGQY